MASAPLAIRLPPSKDQAKALGPEVSRTARSSRSSPGSTETTSGLISRREGAIGSVGSTGVEQPPHNNANKMIASKERDRISVSLYHPRSCTVRAVTFLIYIQL